MPGAMMRGPELSPVSGTGEGCIVIGLINNMPDAALEATEAQFSSLLTAAAGEREVRLRLSYLPEVKRGPEAQEYLRDSYWPLAALQEDPPDALIVTGAEPLAPQLAQEPYWQRFISIVDWADRHTVSSIWSCLAAHGAVQHLSGIRRQRLPDKCCGVYEHELLEGHPLNAGLVRPLLTPQSRWNDLPARKLRDAGYTIASESTTTGANVITMHRQSLMVFFQGHPEYESWTLLREYRRDVARFLAGANPHYPTLPQGYFSEPAIQRLNEFRESAMAQRSPQWISNFPFETEARELTHSWKAASIILYANWLSFIAQALDAARKPAPQPDGIVTK
jgi:homoserine O-succinyltransferase/O-acetyltransferase